MWICADSWVGTDGLTVLSETWKEHKGKIMSSSPEVICGRTLQKGHEG